MAGPVPPAVRWLLERAAPPAHRDWLVADLEEEAAARARTHGLEAARRWSWRQLGMSVVPLVAQRCEAAAASARRTQMQMWRGLRSDLQISWRRLVAAPGFAIVCVLTLALGIGGNTAVFTLIDRVILQPLPVSRPGELYRVGDGDDCCVNSGLQGSFSLFSYDLYRHLRDAAPEFSDLAAFQANTGTMTIGRPDADALPGTLRNAFVSGNYFRMLGLAPAAGRLLAPDDDRAGAAPVAVLSHRAWTERYHGDSTIPGTGIVLNGVAATIVGVAPEGFYGETLRPNPADIWVPLSTEPVLQPQARLLDLKGSHWLYIIGRLRPGVRPASLEPRLTAALQQWITGTLDLGADERPHVSEQHITLVPAATGIRSMRDEVAPSLKLLQAIAATVLLIACANLANLLLARGLGRRTETAVRIALGAPRARLIAQFLVDSVLLACLGGIAGLAVSFAGARAIVEMTFRGASQVPLDATPSLLVILFAFAVSLATGIAFGVVPAAIASRSDPIDAMRGAGRTSGDRGSRVRRSLIALQIALSLVLLTCAGLLARSLSSLQAQDFGFAIGHRYVVDLIPAFGDEQAGQLASTYARIRERLTDVPGVASAALSLYSPMSGDNWASLIAVEGHDPSERLVASWNRVTPGYFETIGTTLVRGRPVTDRDRPGSPLVTVVNTTFAARFFGDADPIGRRIGFNNARGTGKLEFEIVGIVGDAKYQDPKAPAYATFFLPFLQSTEDSRVDGAPGVLDRSHYPKALELHLTSAVPDLESQVRRAIAGVDRRIAVQDVRTMAEQVSGNFNLERLMATLAMAFAAVALLLACLGLYGVTAYSVGRRTREIGIRMAVGASRGGVLRTILRGALAQLAAGLALGVPAAFAAGRLLGANLFGVSPYDPATLAAACAVLAGCAIVAAVIPARRAAALDPVRALRVE